MDGAVATRGIRQRTSRTVDWADHGLSKWAALSQRPQASRAGSSSYGAKFAPMDRDTYAGHPVSRARVLL